MHKEPIYRSEPTILHLNFARTRSFGILAVNGSSGPILVHVPLLFDESGMLIETHVDAASDLMASLQTQQPCTIAISGPDGYVSPDWYNERKHTRPSWNYVAIHLEGHVGKADDVSPQDYLRRMAESFEARLTPKTPWTSEELSPASIAQFAQTRQILRVSVSDVRGTWKLSQDKSEAARLSAARQLRQSPLGQQTEVLAALMIGGGVTGLDF